MIRIPSGPSPSRLGSFLRDAPAGQLSRWRGLLTAVIPLIITWLLIVAVASATASGGAPVANDDPGVISSVSKVLSADGEASDILGLAVAVSGDTAVVGAPNHKSNGIGTGAAYVFVRAETGWKQQAELVAEDGASGDGFGSAVSISGDTVLVGARNASRRGSAYVFTRSGSSWTQQAKLTASDAAVDDYLGSAVSLSGDTVAVGAYGDDDSGSYSGSAYVFTRSGTSWTQEAKLTASDGAADAEFGSAISISGDSVLVGAPDGEGRILRSGSAYVFTRSGTTWAQEAKLVAADGAWGDCFGGALSISGDTAAVGSSNDDDKGSDSGSAYVFLREGATWTQQPKLTASDGAANEFFGSAISISGDNLAVGAGRDGDSSGSAYLFTRSGIIWTQRSKLTDPTGGAGDGFGYSVAATPSGAVVGSPGDSDLGMYSGSAFFTEESYQAREDEPLAVATPGVLRNDSDSEADSLTATLVTDATHGAVSLAANGAFTYTPAPDWWGTDSFTYRAHDGSAYSQAATVTIVVAAVADVPAVLADRAETAEDQQVVIDPLLNDFDADGDKLTLSIVGRPVHGAVTVDGSGHVTYAPSANWFGTDAFSYRLNDGTYFSAPATVTVTVAPVNDPPSAGDDPSLIAAARAVSADDSAAGDFVGQSVSVSGDTAVVGAAGRDDVGADVGAAYVFMRSGATWVQQARLVANDPGANAHFGASVAISGDTVVVGSSGDDHVGTSAGSAYVFKLSGGTWTQQAKLTASDAEEYDNFGLSVSVSGESIAVGSPGDQMTSGSVYVFTRSGSTWAQQTKLMGDVPRTGHMFGYAVSLDGDTVAVGSPGSAEPFGAESGAVYAFARTDGVWKKQGRLIADDYANWANLGTSVALSGDDVLAGAPGRRPGSAYVFSRSGVAWDQQAKLKASDGAVDEDFGVSVGLSGGTAIVGSPDLRGVGSGAARSFVRTAGSWAQSDKFVPSDASANDHFGYSVAVSGQSAVVGAPGQDDLSADCGAMYASTPWFVAGGDGILRVVPSGGVLGNDSDIDGDKLTAQVLAAPTNGNLTLSADGAFVYTPALGWVGSDSFTYRAFDGSAYSSPATVMVMTLKARTAPAAPPVPPAPPTPPLVVDRAVTRVAGANRFEVAANLARKGWDPANTKTWAGVKHVIVANGENGKEADPLAAAGLAGAYDCPVLLTGRASLPAATKTIIAEIAKKNPGLKVHIIGGTGSVPDARWAQIKAIRGVLTAKDRIAGANRYDVSANIANRIVSVAGAGAIKGVILIAADNPAAFYDALAASPIAYANRMPMLSVQKKSVPPSVAKVLKSVALKGKPRYAASSSTYIGAGSLSGATRLTTSASRYTAASQIANKAIAESWATHADTGLAAKLPDALTGGAFAGKRSGVMLFTTSSGTIQSVSKAFITARKASITSGWVIGGTGSVPSAQETSFRNLLR